jgi:hypothetical protein
VLHQAPLTSPSEKIGSQDAPPAAPTTTPATSAANAIGAASAVAANSNISNGKNIAANQCRTGLERCRPIKRRMRAYIRHTINGTRTRKMREVELNVINVRPQFLD